MRDLTEGPISRHIFAMAGPIAIGLIVQTLYYLVDIYFVAALGDTSLAGVTAAGNAMFLIIGVTQILNVGTMALVSHASGRKNREEANLVFNQGVTLAGLFSAATIVLGYLFAGNYIGTIGADAATALAGRTYLYWILPGMALQFPMAVMASALRGTGIVKPTMIVQMLTVVVNIILAPILIAGWGTGHPLGVAGAGLATTLAVVAGNILLAAYFFKLEKFVAFLPDKMPPRLDVWRRMLAIGLPSGGEFILMFLYMAVIYWIIREFGAAAQAGFGLGSRLMQAIFLPAMAIAFAAPAVAGQNFGAGHGDRVRQTFRAAVIMSSTVMFLLTLFCQWRPEILLHGFTDETGVIAAGAVFLSIISWNFVFSGIIFTCSGMFQALGNTWPALFSVATRLLTFALPAIWLSRQADFRIEHVWYLSVVTVALQAGLSVLLLQWQFRLRLKKAPTPIAA